MTAGGGASPRIVSASRRTDVPGFHARWMRNRLRAGSCHVVHPYNGRVARVSLAPEDVLAIVFWTRNPAPLVPHLRALRDAGYPMLFQLTITGYGPPLETHNPPAHRQVELARKVADSLGPDAVLWRYDPILLDDDRTPSWHERRFDRLAARLEGITRRCTFSFVDLYGKTARNLARVEKARGRAFRHPDRSGKRTLARSLAGIAARRGMALLSCCDDSLLGDGVGKSRCVDPEAVRAVRGGHVPDVPARPTRKDCGCVASVDVGSYDTCAFGCAYCYATSSRAAARRRLSTADPEDSVLWRPPSLTGIDLDRRAAAETPGVRAGSSLPDLPLA